MDSTISYEGGGQDGAPRKSGPALLPAVLRDGFGLPRGGGGAGADPQRI